MPGERETLSELIERRMRELAPPGEKLTNRDVWRRGGGLTGEWSHQAVNDLISGATKNPRDKVIERLALALEVPANEIRAAAGQRRHNRPFQMPPRAAALSDAERRVMIDVLDALLGKYRDDAQSARGAVRQLRPVQIPEPPASAAARRGRSRGKDQIRAQDEAAERGDDDRNQ